LSYDNKKRDERMMQFKGFKPDAMQRIAGTLGYQGEMDGFEDYLSQNPDKNNAMNVYQNKAIQMMNGGMVRKQYAEGGSIVDVTAERIKTPKLPTNTSVDAVGTVVADDQLLNTTSGQLQGNTNSGTATADTSTATVASTTAANKVGTATVSDDLDAVTDAKYDPVSGKLIDKGLVAEEGEVSEGAKVVAETSDTSSVSKLDAATGEGILMDDPKKRVLEDAELVAGSTVDPEKAAEFTEKIQAATATPTEKATVRGQLEDLMGDFEGGATPAWAAGAMRGAMGAMAARGLGASSLAGQALVQAAMESAIPIASADASTFASFESQNLSNRQQRAMLGAQQRAQFMGQKFDQEFQSRVMNASKVSDVANMNFNAEQQVALENSRIANTMNLANLSNEQALVMAEAASLSQLDMASLSNRQQAAVQNAQNLMQMDLTNLSNRQATTMFKAQQKIQALFTDRAAENASNQFNASSQNQTDQFFANLKTQTAQFNSSQTNAQNQFNAGEINTQDNFNSEMMNQREQFNANNKLVIEQSNAVWRREVATAGTAATNRANELNASALLDISNTAYNNTWQYYADTMENAYTATNNERDRMTQLAIKKLDIDAKFDIAEWQSDAASSAAMGNAIVRIATTDFSGVVDGLTDAWDWWNSE